MTQEQKNVIEGIVKQCGGLPLAIVVVGGLLAQDSSLEGYEKVRQDLTNILNTVNGRNRGVGDVLALSYHYLPYHLKACFLYLSLFPEDCEIEAKMLVKMWIAEGFVAAATTGGETMTTLDIGLCYLNELVNRCILQAEITKFTKRVRYCRLHDLMRDFCRKKALEENFVAEFGLQQSIFSSSPNRIRRLAVKLKQVVAIPDGQHQHVRSWSVYSTSDDEVEMYPWNGINSLLKGFKFLKVFNMVGLRYNAIEGELSEDIGNLIHLRYLRVQEECKGLPTSLGNLILLQTLDLQCVYDCGIPDVLWKLKELRHLHLPVYEGFFTYKLRLDGLSKLETLWGFHSGRSEVGDLATLANLRKLDIEYCKVRELAKILESPMFSESNSRLRSSHFNINGDVQTQEEHVHLCKVSACCRVTRLNLSGLVCEETFLHNLSAKITSLTLRKSGLKEDPFPALQKMPNLRKLHLGPHSYIGKKMECLVPETMSTISFPRLTGLFLMALEISEWNVEQGAMPCLSILRIAYCDKLNGLPDGLKFITTLQTMDITKPTESLKERLVEGGADFHKIQHIRVVTIH